MIGLFWPENRQNSYGGIRVVFGRNKVVELPADQSCRLAAAIDRFYTSDDLAASLEEFVGLIDVGCADAYFFAGCIYEEGGGGVERDLDKARFYYQKAIEESGAVEAYLGLAKFYHYGMGVKRDYVKAFEYYTIVNQDTGNAIAQLMLGKIHHYGQGTKKDLVKARDYYNLAIAKGNVYAIRGLASLEAEQGNHIKSLWLRLKAGLIAFNIGRKNLRDARLRRG